MVKHDKLMMAHDCDFIKMVNDIKDRDGGEFPVSKLTKSFPQNGSTGSSELTRLKIKRATGEGYNYQKLYHGPSSGILELSPSLVLLLPV